MKFFSSLLALSFTMAASEDALRGFLRKPPAAPCTDWSKGIALEKCSVHGIILWTFKLMRQTPSCKHSIAQEIKALTGTTTVREARDFLKDMCQEAIQAVDTSPWTAVDGEFTDDFMEEYINGETVLNNETGNFQNADGTDPRYNANYPTTNSSYFAGVSINRFYKNQANKTLLEPIPSMKKCKLSAMMCCFGRDRQYDDNNGDCSSEDCDDADPADNTNYCFTKDPEQAWPEESEGGVHCHGLAWGRDKSDFSYLARFNNLFYVAMYDHMYTRGYVEPAVDGVPMCGCIEDMNPVSRSDCTQIDVKQYVRVTMGENDFLTAKLVTKNVEFNACEGIIYENGRKVPKDNDLAAHINLLVAQGKMKNKMRKKIFKKTLVGSNNPNDNENEAACVKAWKKFSNNPYEY